MRMTSTATTTIHSAVADCTWTENEADKKGKCGNNGDHYIGYKRWRCDTLKKDETGLWKR
jgi:hypothetical protein